MGLKAREGLSFLRALRVPVIQMDDFRHGVNAFLRVFDLALHCELRRSSSQVGDCCNLWFAFVSTQFYRPLLQTLQQRLI